MSDGPDAYEFDVAVSFAGEDRELVEEIIHEIRGGGASVFYDEDYLAESWGEDLIEYFDGVYRKRASYAMIFVSRHYAEKMWCRQERRSALARAAQERSAYVLPVRLDDTELDGLLPTVGYVDARREGVSGVSSKFLARWSGGTAIALVNYDGRVPRVPDEMQELLERRPPGWEYLYYAGALHLGLEAREATYLDHELRYSRPGPVVADGDVLAVVSAAASWAGALATRLEPLFAPEAFERAFGPPGQAGDPARISHMAGHLIDLYVDFMTWAADLRGLVVDEQVRPLVSLLATYADGPVEQMRSYIREVVQQVDQIPDLIASGEPGVIEVRLVLALPEAAAELFSSECERLRRVGWPHS